MSLPRSSWILLSVSFLLTLLFVTMTFVLLNHRHPDMDRDAAQFFQQAAAEHHFRRAIMIGFTHSGGVPAMILLSIVGSAWQRRRGDRRLAVCWVAITISGALFNVAMKTAIDRPRPPAEWRDAAVTEDNESYPSGHSMGSLIGYGMVGYAALLVLRRRAAKIGVVVALAVVVGMIGFSRIYLRAHWLTDVIGGFLIGGAWLTFGLTWVEWLRARHRASP